MIDRLVGNKLLAAGIRLDIIERTDGIPLFVEEMIEAVLEAEGDDAAQKMVAAVPSPALAVPPSLHASLTARLDRLGPAKEVAHIGAAIGREFSHALLAAVVQRTEAELGSALDRPIRASLLFRQGEPMRARPCSAVPGTAATVWTRRCQSYRPSPRRSGGSRKAGSPSDRRRAGPK